LTFNVDERDVGRAVFDSVDATHGKRDARFGVFAEGMVAPFLKVFMAEGADLHRERLERRESSN